MKYVIFLTCFLAFLCNVNAQNTTNSTASETDQNDDTIYELVDQVPKFPGGESTMRLFLSNNVQYPKEALAKNIEGTVVIKFVVEKDGSLSNLEVVRDPGEGLGKEGIRIIQLMPAWEPGMKEGKKVRVKMIAPIKFKLGKK